jgi:signal transduction histidine kinase
MDAHQRQIYITVLVAAVIIGSILLYIIALLVRQQRKNKRLYKSKILAEITTLEKERARIANDLHDELGLVLSTIKVKLSSIEVHDPDDKIQLQESSDYLDDMIKRFREISKDLMPTLLLRKGLVEAIEEFIEKIAVSKNLKIIFQSSDIPVLPNELAINFYRIILEIIHNTVKHAKATNLTIEMKKQNDFLFLNTQDNGVGFNYTAAMKGNPGLGLRNLLSRTDIMNGHLYIESKVNTGTKYSIQIPYHS